MTRHSILAAALLAAIGCGSTREPALFELRSPDETGIDFANTLIEDDSVFNPNLFDYLYNGAGVAVGDLNNDGLQDIYFAGNLVSSRLYLNRGGLRFEDVTQTAGVGTEVWATGVAMVDINQDGWLDIYVCVAGNVPEAQRANLLFVNQGADENGVPRFVEQAEAYGIADTGYSTHAAFLDYDRDGDLDLYLLTNALEKTNRNLIRPKRVNGEAASTDRLYRNNGDGTFTNVSREAGILIEGYGLGVAVSDLNQDGWPDIYAANDFLSNDLVWINNGDGTFTNRAAQYLKHQTHNAMGVDIADYNNDGLDDIIVLDMLPPDNLRQKMMVGGSNYDRFHMALQMGYQPQYMRNTLQLNNGPGPDGHPTFSEIGQLAGVHETDWSWAPLFADFDNDGLRDLFISNGYRRDVTNLDYIVYTQERHVTSGDYIYGYGYGSGLPVGSEERHKRLFDALMELPEVRIPNYIFKNNGDLTFSDRTKEWGLDIPSFSNGAAYADLDNDGDLDLVVNNIDGPAFLFENRGERLPNRHYLRIALQGPPGNRDALGTRVVIRYGGQQQYHYHSPYRGYKSTVEPIVHFGLGAVSTVDSVEVYWPDGSYQLLTGVPADQVIRVDHADARERWPAEKARPAALFRQVADRGGLTFRHQEREVADFKHTPLLPHKHSKNGPGIAVGDVDGNGLDDVYLGTDRGFAKELFLQTSPGRFTRQTLPGDTDYEDMGALFFDADGDGDLDLYVVSGGAFIAGDGLYQDRLYLNDGKGRLVRAEDALPRENASGSSVVAADYDGDGDLDLFVGGRIVPGKYPLPARSYLLRNDSRPGGPVRFTDVTDEVAPGLAEVGLVTSALWSDYDNDGDPDLIVAGEWMPLTFFRNDGGRFTNATATTGLGDTRGWWNSLAAGDFDHDGDVDYVAGNRGLNSRFKASPDRPFRVYAADFDQNGSFDPILFHYIGDKSYPVAWRDALIDQIIAMKGRFPRYIDYARATVERTLSEKERRSAYVAEVVTFASSYVENLGGGRFAIRPLPIRAQAAPIFGMQVGDYDGDGWLDVLIVGNSYATETQAGWYDALTGGILRGDGKGRFEYIDGNRSGFFVDGDAKAIAEVLLDEGRSLILATQNADSLRVFARAAGGEAVRRLRVEPLDAYAVITLRDGGTRRQDLTYGSTYLSQSSRYLEIPANAVEVVIYDCQGSGRTIRF
ncbi:MAG TPA: VCBS repeat-containing protein [Longimicrobiales bacterium]